MRPLYRIYFSYRIHRGRERGAIFDRFVFYNLDEHVTLQIEDLRQRFEQEKRAKNKLIEDMNQLREFYERKLQQQKDDPNAAGKICILVRSNPVPYTTVHTTSFRGMCLAIAVDCHHFIIYRTKECRLSVPSRSASESSLDMLKT